MVAAACSLWALGCGNDRAGDPDAGMPLRERMCPQAQSVDHIPQRRDAIAPIATLNYDELAAAVMSACGECHKSPSTNGGFSYTASHAGLASAAGQMATVLAKQTMPPKDRRDADPAGYLRLGSRLQAWIAAGKPETGTFPLPDETVASGQQLPAAIASAMTDLGDCVPVQELIGKDPERDAMFASTTALPAQLEDTDLVSLDAFALAQRGTVAFDVEYPLWADNAHKGRWVHVPTVVAGGVATRQPIAFDPATGQFQIPDNTRFYKTFFKQVTETDGVVRYRKVETRLIVVRHAPATPLFGSYLWDATERSATLHTTPYRDGTPFKDLVLQLESDATTGEVRTYAVPGRNRCNDCHQGSESDSFILGFTPLQLNRRNVGEAGREAAIEPDELSQLARLTSYGVIAGIGPDTAPRLETFGGAKQPRNIHELRLQGYATGNCAHCHNQKGYAWKQGITLLMAPPALFQFARGQGAKIGGSTLMVPSSPDNSVLYQHVSQETHVQGSDAVLHMPLHTPGIDCNGVNLMGKWIKSIPASVTPTSYEIDTALQAADGFVSACQPAAKITWLDEDFSDPPIYVPRRQDWNDPENGIPAPIRGLAFTDSLFAMADAPVPDGYWANLKQNGVPLCRFPEVLDPSGGVKPWMLDVNGDPKRPFGELRYQKPGEYFFQNVCAKCHGVHANADSALAKTILALTGGATRVANLHDGLFGHAGANTALFDADQNDGTTRNLAPNYLVWMASGGTQATFPTVLGDIVGDHGGNMLFLVRTAYCATLLPGSASVIGPSNGGYDVVSAACTFENPIVPADHGYAADGRTPLNATLQSAWLDRAVRNVGFAIFRYLLVDGSVDHWQPTDCRVLYPASST
jgi:mono/diheme cytochrome c family protein